MDKTFEAIIAGAKANGSWDKKYPVYAADTAIVQTLLPKPKGEHMTDVYKTMEEEKLKLEAIAREARVELTPELRVFAWLIKHHALIDFWDSAAKQAKCQHEMLERFLEREKNT